MLSDIFFATSEREMDEENKHILRFAQNYCAGTPNQSVHPIYMNLVQPRHDAALKVQRNWKGAKQRRINYRDFFRNPPWQNWRPGMSLFRGDLPRWGSYLDYVKYSTKQDKEIRKTEAERARTGFGFGLPRQPVGLPQLTRNVFHTIGPRELERWRYQNVPPRIYNYPIGPNPMAPNGIMPI